MSRRSLITSHFQRFLHTWWKVNIQHSTPSGYALESYRTWINPKLEQIHWLLAKYGHLYSTPEAVLLEATKAPTTDFAAARSEKSDSSFYLLVL